MTFCHREVIHAQWKILLEDDFIEAWKHGIVITCCDGVARRFYPRIFTHSGDYPEKYEFTILCSVCFVIHALQNPPGKHSESGHVPMPAVSYPPLSRT